MANWFFPAAGICRFGLVKKEERGTPQGNPARHLQKFFNVRLLLSAPAAEDHHGRQAESQERPGRGLGDHGEEAGRLLECPVRQSADTGPRVAASCKCSCVASCQGDAIEIA